MFIFTTLLFLSGYVLQQQTVRNLQAVIKPPPPPPSRTLSLSASASASAVARVFGDPPGSPGRVAYKEYLTESRPKDGWRKVAYVQLVTEHLQVCSAVMLFAELARQKSKAERVLLYPKGWDKGEDRVQEPMNPYHETSKRLLKAASGRYGVVLKAMEPRNEAKGKALTSLIRLNVLTFSAHRASSFVIFARRAFSSHQLQPRPLPPADRSSLELDETRSRTGNVLKEPANGSTDKLFHKPGFYAYTFAHSIRSRIQ